MEVSFNLDLLSLGIATAVNVILGFAVFQSNQKHATNRLFFAFSLALVIWSVATYFSYQAQDNLDLTLFLARLVMFSAVPLVYLFFLLMHTFPNPVIRLPRWFIYGYSLFAVLTMIIAFSPHLFSSVIPQENTLPQPIIGFGIILFIFTAILPIPIAIYFAVRRFFKKRGEQRYQIGLLLSGAFIMFSLVVAFSFVAPTAFGTTRFIPYTTIFTLPFSILTAFAILRYRLLNIKAAVTSVFISVLAIITFSEIILATDVIQRIYRSVVLILIIIIGNVLIRGVIKEIEQREEIQRLADNLEKANEKLREADRMKTKLMSIATHDLRSPLGAIKGYSSMLLEGTYGKLSEASREATQKILEVSERMNGIVEDFLNVSRIEQGRLKFQFEEADLVKLVESVVKEQKPQAQEKGLELTFETKIREARVKIDVGKMEQMVTNLIDNAIKYTPRGSVRVSLNEQGDVVRLTVQDTGVGIPKESMDSLFKEFSRLEGGEQENRKGTGLGLYIAKVMIEAHKGKIWAESDGEGKGSRFIIELPLV